jgi:hypothetical protein
MKDAKISATHKKGMVNTSRVLASSNSPVVQIMKPSPNRWAIRRLLVKEPSTLVKTIHGQVLVTGGIKII